MNSNQNNKPSPNEHLAPLTQQQKQANLNTIRLLDQQGMTKTIDLIEQKVYERIMKKALKYKLTQTLKLRKVIDSQDQYHYEDYLQDVYKIIKSNADVLDMWVKKNIFERQEYVKMKEQMHKTNERKARKAAEIQALIEKIGDKYKDKKVNETIDKFRQMRKANVTKYTPLEQQIRSKNQQIRHSIEKRAKNNDLSDIKKAADEMKQYQLSLERSTTITLDKLDKLLL